MTSPFEALSLKEIFFADAPNRKNYSTLFALAIVCVIAGGIIAKSLEKKRIKNSQ